MKRLVKFLAPAGLLLAAAPALASNICKTGRTCTAAEMGPFMKNITAKCGNFGDCQYGDIMTVVNNVGNFTLGIVGSLVLLFYVYGGFMFLTSRGDQAAIKKGKDAIRISTIGLVIVFVAQAVIKSLVVLVTHGGTFI